MGSKSRLKLKKSLGQNFFTNAHLAQKIVDKACENNPRSVLEIGPGDGYFTKLFEQKGLNITVIEKDTELAQFLKLKFPDINVINSDFLELDITKLEVGPEWVAYGSLPYNISKKIIRIVLEQMLSVSDFYFIIQKEVADKYCDLENSSTLSINTQVYADCKKVITIKPSSFTPKPKVDSCFVHFKRNENLKKINNLKIFEQIVKSAHSNPRKMLRNNLKAFNNIEQNFLDMRPSQLKLADYISIANAQK